MAADRARARRSYRPGNLTRRGLLRARSAARTSPGAKPSCRAQAASLPACCGSCGALERVLTWQSQHQCLRDWHCWVCISPDHRG
eukprot:scaffold6349_cov115-Isochrysis_galbana.AAC.7